MWLGQRSANVCVADFEEALISENDKRARVCMYACIRGLGDHGQLLGFALAVERQMGIDSVSWKKWPR